MTVCLFQPPCLLTGLSRQTSLLITAARVTRTCWRVDFLPPRMRYDFISCNTQYKESFVRILTLDVELTSCMTVMTRAVYAGNSIRAANFPEMRARNAMHQYIDMWMIGHSRA